MPDDDVRLLGEILDGWAGATPDGEALAYQDRKWTWRELHDQVARLSGALSTAGIGRGDRVAFVDKNHSACLQVTFAAAALGAANAVVNWRLSADELIYVLNDSGARILFVGAELLPAVEALGGELSTVEKVIVVGGEADEFDGWVAQAEPFHGASVVQDDDGALILYTSGTTGFPKGAVLTHRGLLAHTDAASAAFPMTDTSRNLVAMPLFHVGGSCYALVSLFAGVPTTMTREPDPASLFAALAAGVTHAFLVPAVVAAIVQAGEQAIAAFSRLHYLGYGASPMPLPVLRRALGAWPETKFVQVYGMTEMSGMVAALSPEAHLDAEHPQRLASAGTTLPGIELRVVDPARGEDVEPGTAGELWFRTDQRMSGYLGKPGATAETITADGWLRTGDIGRVDDGGFIFIEDRVKDMIITGGENVYSPEVERVIAGYPAIGEVAVIGVPDEKWGESVKAVVAPAPGETIDEGKLVEYCRARLAHYKCPRTVDVVEALPRNATGKILKRSLRKKYWQDQSRNV
jgi:acyl-CoA synthetase (AMP-forming)/AMP-acid ligase II